MIIDNDMGHANRVREHCFFFKVSHKLSVLYQASLGVELSC